jgi:hypothetical protein
MCACRYRAAWFWPGGSPPTGTIARIKFGQPVNLAGGAYRRSQAGEQASVASRVTCLGDLLGRQPSLSRTELARGS